tara:strand:+ start:1533 stop:2153 length:621 start_codon:yes stop_codon:yes gene_type:complete
MSGFEALQQKLIQAKAVMNKVDGMPSKMNGAQQTMTESSNPNLPPVSNNFNTQSIDTVIDNNNKLASPPKITEEKVKNSNLPDAIKKLMIDHPIPEVSFGNQIPDSLIEGAAEKMKKLAGVSSSPEPLNYKSSSSKKISSSPKTQKITQSSLKNLVRETIVESLDELIDERLSQRIVESNGLEESIKLVVGNTIFEGKILTTKKIS